MHGKSAAALNYNPEMEYRRLGKTGLTVSAVCLGGHWKRIGAATGRPLAGSGYDDAIDTANLGNAEFLASRSEVVSRAIEAGFNYVDACSPQEILAYARVLKGRRDRMYFGFSWHTREPRSPEWRQARKLVEGLEDGLKEAGLEYVDLWRISLPVEGITDPGERRRVEEATAAGLELAKKQGKARFAGVSSHDRAWLASFLERYPKQIEVVLFPYTAGSKRRPEGSLFDAIETNDAGVLTIKPFADSSLFRGDSSPGNPEAARDDRRARLALRRILANPVIAAALPGLASPRQVENAALAMREPRRLDTAEEAELDAAAEEMWARVQTGRQRWLAAWEHV